MSDPHAPRDPWPDLPLSAWQDTCATLHMETQIVGKIRLALAPMVNHWWQVSLYVTPRGLTTSPMPHGTRTLEIRFDLFEHRLQILSSDGLTRAVPLEARPVADFYREVMEALRSMGLQVRIWTVPVEVEERIPFERDTKHASYDPLFADRFRRVLIQAERVFQRFRARFLGKASPVHFFWGSFDLAATRFSGRPAPPHPGSRWVAASVMREAYSQEVSSAGFWPGTGLGEPAFYAYAYPQPSGFRSHPVKPQAAYYHEQLGEFLLAYEAVRTAADPDEQLLSFLQSTYEAAAVHGGWNRAALERVAERGGRNGSAGGRIP